MDKVRTLMFMEQCEDTLMQALRAKDQTELHLARLAPEDKDSNSAAYMRDSYQKLTDDVIKLRKRLAGYYIDAYATNPNEINPIKWDE